MDNVKEKLIGIIVTQTGWGPVSGWQGGDFRKLSGMIFDKTRINLSESTLRRVMGKTDYPHEPSETTLNTLAIFAGFESWRAFRQPVSGQQARPLANRLSYLWYAAGIALAIIFSVTAYQRLWSNIPAGFAYAFSSRPVTHSLPNSVIFNYRVSTGSQEVFIQQSWDNRTRTKVPANGNTFASVYYRPGFYQAKLIVGDKVVKEHPLIIPTTGWEGLLYRLPVPVYLGNAEFVKADRLEVAGSIYTTHGVRTEPDPVRAELYNVGNFKAIAANEASFSALIKCDDDKGAAVCRKAMAFLITNGIPVSIPISAKGCVATLGLFNGRALISGKTTDLSGFGTDESSWVKVAYRTANGKMELLLNDKIVYSGPTPPAELKIIGIAFGFENGGAVKSIVLKEKGNVVFTAY
jgi:hypothetical protein